MKKRRNMSHDVLNPPNFMPKKKRGETYSYKGWLTSESIVKRALAVYAYGLLGGIIIMGIFFAIGGFMVMIGVGDS